VRKTKKRERLRHTKKELIGDTLRCLFFPSTLILMGRTPSEERCFTALHHLIPFFFPSSLSLYRQTRGREWGTHIPSPPFPPKKEFYSLCVLGLTLMLVMPTAQLFCFSTCSLLFCRYFYDSSTRCLSLFRKAGKPLKKEGKGHTQDSINKGGLLLRRPCETHMTFSTFVQTYSLLCLSVLFVTAAVTRSLGTHLCIFPALCTRLSSKSAVRA
jgi:hypothetical protein